MSRRAARTDANHAEIRDGLRDLGYCVHDTSGAGAGFPDLVVGPRGLNILLEIKDPGKPQSARRLTPAQEEFHVKWRGQVDVVHTVDEAVEMIKRAAKAGAEAARKEAKKGIDNPEREM